MYVGEVRKFHFKLEGLDYITSCMLSGQTFVVESFAEADCHIKILNHAKISGCNERGSLATGLIEYYSESVTASLVKKEIQAILD